MLDKYGVAHDNYCYPNSDVLINKLNIRNTEDLAEAETEFTTLRYKEYRSESSSINRFTFDHLKELHHHLFQDLYEWAGEIRTIDISKGETRFCTSCQWPLKLIHFRPIKLTHLRSGFANFLLQSIAFSSEHKYV